MNPTLWNLKKNDTCLVQGFGQDLEDRYRVRLQELGFHRGESVRCVQSPHFGAPRLFRVRNSVYSLDPGIARKVFVRKTRP